MVARYFEPYEFYLTAGAIYLATTYVIVGIFHQVERRLSGHLRDRPSAPVPGLKL